MKGKVVRNGGYSIETKERIDLGRINANEAIILSFLPLKWKWIARDADGILHIFTSKPRKERSKYKCWKPEYKTLAEAGRKEFIVFPYRQMFKGVSWSDSQPTNIDKLIRGE